MRSVRALLFALTIATLVVTAGAHLFSAIAYARHSQSEEIQQQGEKRPKKNKRLTHEERVDQRVAMMTKELDLSQRQADTIRKILLERNSRKADHLQKQSLTTDEKKAVIEKMLTDRKACQDKIIAVLTPTQRTKYDATLKGNAGSYWHQGHKFKK